MHMYMIPHFLSSTAPCMHVDLDWLPKIRNELALMYELSVSLSDEDDVLLSCVYRKTRTTEAVVVTQYSEEKAVWGISLAGERAGVGHREISATFRDNLETLYWYSEQVVSLTMWWLGYPSRWRHYQESSHMTGKLHPLRSLQVWSRHLTFGNCTRIAPVCFSHQNVLETTIRLMHASVCFAHEA